MNIFNENFLKISSTEIADQIKKIGFFKLENALTSEFISNIETDVNKSGLSLNNNGIGGVYFTHGNQFFLTALFLSGCWGKLQCNSAIFGAPCKRPSVVKQPTGRLARRPIALIVL